MLVVRDSATSLRVGGVHADVLGSGAPVTLFAHGLGGSTSETRPLAARLRGTRVLVEFRGHGRSDALPGGWDYDLLAGDLCAVVDLLMGEVPASVRERRGTRVLLTRRAAQLLERPSPQPLSDDRPLHGRALLRLVEAPSLVVAQADDPLHRLDVATELAAALPACTGVLALPPGGVFWTAARAVQQALADHLTPEDA